MMAECCKRISTTSLCALQGMSSVAKGAAKGIAGSRFGAWLETGTEGGLRHALKTLIGMVLSPRHVQWFLCCKFTNFDWYAACMSSLISAICSYAAPLVGGWVVGSASL